MLLSSPTPNRQPQRPVAVQDGDLSLFTREFAEILQLESRIEAENEAVTDDPVAESEDLYDM
jgi:hypothetical protein